MFPELLLPFPDPNEFMLEAGLLLRVGHAQSQSPGATSSTYPCHPVPKGGVGDWGLPKITDIFWGVPIMSIVGVIR